MPETNEQTKKDDIDLSKLPQNLDLTAESITANVHEANANCPDDRMKFVFKSLVNHMHDFVRETSLTTEEWMTAVDFIAETGKIRTDSRHEFILLFDTLGVSALVDSINCAKPPGATESTVLGPFFTEDTHEVKNGDSIASEGKGDYMFVEGRVLDLRGNPISHATIDTWETDGSGLYDLQYDPNEKSEPECRGRLHSDKDGSYAFRAVVPISYPIPSDGTVGKMFSKLGRHVFRPAHLHIRINAQGYEELITALYFKGDPYLTSDAVFGVKSSLIVEPEIIDDPSISKARGFKEPKPHTYVKQNFVLATVDEAVEARKKAGAHVPV